MLAAPALGSVIWLEATRLDELGIDILAASGFAVNLVLAGRGTDYLAAELAPSAIQHYWSLAVEEQFYILWPALILLALVGGRRVATVVIAAVTAASLAASITLTGPHPTWSYFGLHTRAWELGLGALLAVDRNHHRPGAGLGPSHARLGRHRRRHRVNRHLRPCRAFSRHLGAPSRGRHPPRPRRRRRQPSGTEPGAPPQPAAMGGRTLLLPLPLALASPRDRRRRPRSGARSHRHPRAHRSCCRPRRGRLPIHREPDSSLTPTHPTPPTLPHTRSRTPHHRRDRRTRRHHRGQNGPHRSHRRRSRTDHGSPDGHRPGGRAPETRRRARHRALLHQQRSSRNRRRRHDEHDDNDQHHHPPSNPADATAIAAIRDALDTEVLPDNLRPSILEANGDTSSLYGTGCHQYREERAAEGCVFGDPDGDLTVALWGDSHAAQWFSAVDRIAEQRGWRLIAITQGGCPVIEVLTWNRSGDAVFDHCGPWRDNVIETFEAEGVDVILLGQHYGLLDAAHPRLGRRRRLGGATAAPARPARPTRRPMTPILLIDSPDPPEDVPTCLAEHPTEISLCEPRPREHRANRRAGDPNRGR